VALMALVIAAPGGDLSLYVKNSIREYFDRGYVRSQLCLGVTNPWSVTEIVTSLLCVHTHSLPSVKTTNFMKSFIT